MERWGRREHIPTALSSMIFWAFVFAAAMVAGFALEAKSFRRKEMVGGWVGWLLGGYGL